MLNDVAKEWVKALRSGEYTQGREWLRRSDNFCCLGVLCDLAVEVGVIPAPEKSSSGVTCYAYDGMVGAPSGKVQTWAGLGNPVALIALNDIEKASFEAIADFIESEPEGLFA